MTIDLDTSFDQIAAVLVQSAKQRSASVASLVAERCGLVELGDVKPSQTSVWELRDGDRSLRFQWRWYDPSQAFSIRPDINILTLELRRGDQVLRRAEERYED
jgi:hypothetical protein